MMAPLERLYRMCGDGVLESAVMVTWAFVREEDRDIWEIPRDTRFAQLVVSNPGSWKRLGANATAANGPAGGPAAAQTHAINDAQASGPVNDPSAAQAQVMNGQARMFLEMEPEMSCNSWDLLTQSTRWRLLSPLMRTLHQLKDITGQGVHDALVVYMKRHPWQMFTCNDLPSDDGGFF